MGKVKGLMAGCAATLMLAGCGAPSVDDLVEDPEKLAEVQVECAELLAKGEDVNSEKCRNALAAAAQAGRDAVEGLMEGMEQP